MHNACRGDIPCLILRFALLSLDPSLKKHRRQGVDDIMIIVGENYDLVDGRM